MSCRQIHQLFWTWNSNPLTRLFYYDDGSNLWTPDMWLSSIVKLLYKAFGFDQYGPENLFLRNKQYVVAKYTDVWKRKTLLILMKLSLSFTYENQVFLYSVRIKLLMKNAFCNFNSNLQTTTLKWVELSSFHTTVENFASSWCDRILQYVQ